MGIEISSSERKHARKLTQGGPCLSQVFKEEAQRTNNEFHGETTKTSHEFVHQ